MEKAPNGNYICQYNPECECKKPKCQECGWNPEVSKCRLKNFRISKGLPTKLYRVPFTGYCEVYANSEEEAVEQADSGKMFFAHYDFGDPERLNKEDDDELD